MVVDRGRALPHGPGRERVLSGGVLEQEYVSCYCTTRSATSEHSRMIRYQVRHQDFTPNLVHGWPPHPLSTVNITPIRPISRSTSGTRVGIPPRTFGALPATSTTPTRMRILWRRRTCCRQHSERHLKKESADCHVAIPAEFSVVWRKSTG